jgi:hypothetical protein
VIFLQDQSTIVSDLMSEVVMLEERVVEMEGRQDEDEEKISSLEKNRVTKAQLDSKKEMVEKAKTSSKQFKLFDVDLKKEISDRKELQAAARAGIAARISESRRAKYEELVRSASMQVLARTSTKRKVKDTDSEIWTAPILVTVEDRETRWELEDILRSNGLFPNFHWDRDMLDSIGKMRSKLAVEYPEDKFMVRMRPEERGGTWQIKADVRPRESKERFRLGATWPIPPLDPAVRDQVEDWDKPRLAPKTTWAKVVAAGQSTAAPAASVETTGDMEVA